MEEISIEALREDGVEPGSTNAPRYPANFDVNSIILAAKFNAAGEVTQVGFIHVISLNVDGNKSNWTFNCYWQK